MQKHSPLVGTRAPDFSLTCTRGPGSERQQVSLADYADRWLVLMFYPRDFSLVCPTEVTAISTRIEEFQRRDCDVLAVSTDSLESHESWIATPRAQGGLGGLNFPLASDEEGTVSQAYSVFLPRQHVALRGLFIIDPNGILQYQLVHNLSVGRRSDEVLRVLDALQTGGLCPESWAPAEPAIDVSATLGPNRVIGQYRIEALLGGGSFGNVFRAHDLTLQRTVALKVFRGTNPSSVESVLNEARSAAALSHPNVCTVFAVENSEGVPVIVMEHIDGKPLSDVLEAGPLPYERVIALGREIAAGMAAAHAQGIIHGDLKPANIMVTHEGTAKIMDFGLARRNHSVQAVRDTIDWEPETRGGLSGTPSYMSPEQARARPLTPVSDVFSFGLILYEMLTGRQAIIGESLLEVMGRIDAIDPEPYASAVQEPFKSLLRQALVADPERRLLTMSAIAERLG
jgi:alkyl hydroperoxide reductase subunit AhpC